MKEIFNVFFRIFLGLIVLFSLLIFHNIERVYTWLEKRLLEKFEINIIITESKDLEKSVNIISELVNKYDKLKFDQKKLLTKKDVWEIVYSREELKHLSTLITKNPFPDIIKLKLLNFDYISLQMFLEEGKKIKDIKEIIYDYNLFSYLNRLTLIKKYFLILKVVIIVTGMFIVGYFLYNIYVTKKIFLLESVFVFIIGLIVEIFGFQVMKIINVEIVFNFNLLITYFAIILVCISSLNLTK